MADFDLRYQALVSAERQRAWRVAERELVNAALGDTLDEAALLRAAQAIRAAFQTEDPMRHSHERPAPPKPCSRCGRNIVYSVWGDEEGESFEIGFGYGSRFDLECWHLTLCDDCCQALAELVESGPGAGVMRFDYLERRWLKRTVQEQMEQSPALESCLEPLPEEATEAAAERVLEPSSSATAAAPISLR